MLILSRILRRLFVALTLLAFAEMAHAQTVVRILQYNIHRDIGNDVTAGSAEQVSLGKIVNYLAPDVWTINELATSNGSGVDFIAAHDALVAFLSTYVTAFGAAPVENVNYFIYVGQRTDGFITSAIVSRYPFLATQTYSDAYPSESVAALRGLVSAYVNLPGAVELGVFTTHLKASQFSDSADTSTLNAKKREGEATADAANLVTWLNAHPGDAAVMNGDFNETEEPAETDNWKVGAIGDSIPNTMLIYHPVTTLRQAGFIDPRPVSIAGKISTIDSVSPNARFDYLFYRGSHLTYLGGQVFDTKQIDVAGQLAALNAANGTTFVRTDTATSSDHLPVLESFLVGPGAPYLFSQSATGIDSTTATLNAGINPNGIATTWTVELGTTMGYGLTSLAQTLGAGTVNVSALLKIAGLAPGTTYHFRISAQNSSGTSTGVDRSFTTAAFLDTDGDGLPNGWETANMLNPNLASDALTDADGDGVSNRDEYAAGTNPRDATSAFRILSIVRAGMNVDVAWPTAFGKRYQLQARESLTAGMWGVVQNNVAGTGGVVTASDTTAVPRFYRAVTLP